MSAPPRSSLPPHTPIPTPSPPTLTGLSPPGPQRQHGPAVIGLLLGCVIFGMGSLIVAHVPLGAFAMAFWRLAVSALIFTGLAFLFRQHFPRSKRALCLALLSGVALGYDLALWHHSIRTVGPGISTLLNSLQIFFLAGIGWIFFREKQTLLQIVSLLLATVGVGLIASPELGRNLQAGWGLVTGLVSGACLAASMTLVRQTHHHEATATLPFMALVGTGGALACLPCMLLWDHGPLWPSTWAELGWVLIYSTVMQCLAWGLIAYSIPRLSLALTGLLLLSEPVAALVLDYFLLHKPMSALQWCGALLTMTAIYLGSTGRHTASRPQSPPKPL